MKLRSFGKTGWNLSEIGFGAWAIGGGWGRLDDAQGKAALNQALDLGVTFIDTALGYGNGHSERLISEVLKERGEKLGNGRIKVATKIPPDLFTGHWPPFPGESWESLFSETYLRVGVEECLKNLRTEALDLLHLHTWTRAWNTDPYPLEILQKLKKEGKILASGVSTPEHDQNCLIDPMRQGLLDAAQIVYNIFEQEPESEFLPVALKHKVAVIVRCVFDEGSLTGKFTKETRFPEGDFRRSYFRPGHLEEAVDHVEAVKKTVSEIAGRGEKSLASVALRFVLKNPAVSTVIPGIRTPEQARLNCAASDEPPLSDELYQALKAHNWRKGIWY
jgi:aryl-alcohol dehydrogenase-like predicted oxidoreductase